MDRDGSTSDTTAVDPVELLRKMLAISPEDAASVREDAAKAAGQRKDDAPKADPSTGR